MDKIWLNNIISGKKKFSDIKQDSRKVSVQALMQQMVDLGAKSRYISAKIAGGAQMFGVASAAFNIGERNAQAVIKVLDTYKIPIIAQDLGGSTARTIYFHTADGRLEVKSAIKPTIII